MKIFYIEQKITPLANQYRVYDTTETGEKRALVAFAHQKRWAFKEKFEFFTDESRRTPLFGVKARKVIDLAAKYDVTNTQGESLGILGKRFKESLLRSTWRVYHPENEYVPLAVATERSSFLAMARRAWGFAPYIGDLPFFVRYHFDFLRPESQHVLAKLDKTTTIRDHYKLVIYDELEEKVDWRTMVALAVMMDALQGR